MESAAIWLVGFSEELHKRILLSSGSRFIGLSTKKFFILSLEVKENFIEYDFSLQSVIAKNLIIYCERRVNIFVNSFRGRDMRRCKKIPSLVISTKDVNRMIFNNRLIVKDKAPFNRL